MKYGNGKGYQKISEKDQIKVFWPAFDCTHHQKAGWNTQQFTF